MDSLASATAIVYSHMLGLTDLLPANGRGELGCQQLNRKLKTISLFFVPTWFDAWLLATALLWAVSFIASALAYCESDRFDLIDLKMPIVLGCAAVTLAVSARVCFARLSTLRVLLFICSIVGAATLVCYSGSWVDVAFPSELDPYQLGNYADPVEYWKEYWLVASSALASATACFVGSYCIRRFSISSRWLKRVLSTIKEHRTRLMIGFVVVMIPAIVLRNLLDTNNRTLPFVMAITLGLFGLLVGAGVIFLLAKFVGRWRRLSAILFVLIVLGVTAFSAYVYLAGNSAAQTYEIGRSVSIVICPLLFLLALAGVWSKPAAGKASRCVSLWTVVLLFAIAGTVLVTMRYDPRVVTYEFANVNDSFWSGGWRQNAIDSQRIKRHTNGAVGLFSQYGQVVAFVEIRGQQDADCLTELAKFNKPLAAVGITNLQPYVDTLHVAKLSQWIAFAEGEITSKQMSDLAAITTGVNVSGVKLPANFDGGDAPKTINMSGDLPPERFAEFLDAYVPAGLCNVAINFPMDDDDCEAIIRHQSNCRFAVNNGELPARLLEASQTQPLNRIEILACGIPHDPKRLKQILESSLSIGTLYIGGRDRDDLLYWDLLMIKPASFSKPLDPGFVDTAKEFSARAKKLHWVFGTDQNDRITQLWLPSVDYVQRHAKILGSLKTLRFDFEGVNNQFGAPESDFAALSKLPSLERLYFDRGTLVESLAFLRGIPKLKHIQIQAQTRSVMPQSGYGVCKNLETMRVFGTLDPITIVELAKLKKLTRIEIVDEDLTYQDPKEVAKLKALLPGVEIKIVLPANVKPDVSDKWKQHIKQIRKDLIERLDKQIATAG